MFETPGSTLSLSIGVCSFVCEEPREAKPVVRDEAESMTVSALSGRVDDVHAVSLQGIFGAESRRAGRRPVRSLRPGSQVGPMA